MHLLPNALRAVTKFAGKPKGHRFAVEGIHLELLDDNKYVCCATDCSRLITVEGTGEKADEYPESAAMQASPNGATTALIPSGVWDTVFAKAKAIKTTKPILKNVAVKVGDKSAALSATDLETTEFKETKLIEGRFPPYRDIWPKKKPRVRFGVDGVALGQVCKALTDVADTDSTFVYIEFEDSGKPLIITPMTQNDKYTAKALLMVVGGGPKDKEESYIRYEQDLEFLPIRQLCFDAKREFDGDCNYRYKAETLMNIIQQIGDYAKERCPLYVDTVEAEVKAETTAGPEDNPADDVPAEEEEYISNVPLAVPRVDPVTPEADEDDNEPEDTPILVTHPPEPEESDLDAAMSAMAFA
jgi:hypothetical protein